MKTKEQLETIASVEEIEKPKDIILKDKCIFVSALNYYRRVEEADPDYIFAIIGDMNLNPSEAKIIKDWLERYLLWVGQEKTKYLNRNKQA